jgi:hypothetical protein
VAIFRFVSTVNVYFKIKMTDRDAYLIPLQDIDLGAILKTWYWLIGEDKTMVALTKSGDALFKDNNNRLYFLNIGAGTVTTVADNYLDFANGKLSVDLYEELLLTGLVDDLVKSGKALKKNQVYSYIMLPILGGAYDTENMYPVNLYEHYQLTGEIHFQLKDLPNGTEVEIVPE